MNSASTVRFISRTSMQYSKLPHSITKRLVSSLLIFISCLLIVWCSLPDEEKAVRLLQESTSVWGIEKIEMLQQARSLDTNNIEIVEALADAALKQGDYVLANKTFKRMESLPWQIDMWRLWRLSVALTQWKDSVAEAIIGEYPQEVLTSSRQMNIWVVYYEYSYMIDASYWFEQALTTDPTNVKARTNMGVVQADLWELSMAKDFLDQARLLHPEDSTIQLNLASVLGDLAYQKRLEWVEATVFVVEALEILEMLIDQDAKNYEARLYKWVLYYENNQYSEAIETFESIIQDDKKNEDAYYYLAKSLADQWSTEIAIETFLKLLEINPRHPWASEELVELGNQ